MIAVDALIARPRAGGAAAAPPHLRPPPTPRPEGTTVYDSRNARGAPPHARLFARPLRGAEPFRSRIQIMQDSFSQVPRDVIMAAASECRCASELLMGAAYVDFRKRQRAHRRAKCIGCKRASGCAPNSRTVWVTIDAGKSSKCASASTPTGTKGAGETNVRELPMKGDRFVAEMPDQKRRKGTT